MTLLSHTGIEEAPTVIGWRKNATCHFEELGFEGPAELEGRFLMLKRDEYESD